MKLVAGLGNPGPRYAASRHNIGFLAVDAAARRWATEVSRYERDFEGLLGDAQRGPERVLLLKPLTYMNLSGRSVAAVLRYYKLSPAELLVVCDDLDLPLGKLRLRASGSSGGQKGLADVIRHLGTEQFARLRIGIGKVDRTQTVDHVLSTFLPEERAPIAEAVERAASAVECWARQGVEAAMNEFNRADDGEQRRPPQGERS